MKKIRILFIAIVVLLSLTVGLLTGCDIPVDHEEGFKLLKSNYETSIAYDIYFTKELISDNVNKEIIHVNSVSDLDKKNNYAKNADGTYVNHNVRVYREKAGLMQSEILVGLSKNGKKDPGKNLKFTSQFTGEYVAKAPQYSREYTAMTPGEYINSGEFFPHRLGVKLAEIGRINREDVIFDGKKGVARTGELTSLKFTLTEDYYKKYLEDSGVESTLRGTYITMELVYGRIANLTVMQAEAGTESIFGVSEYEAYKIEIVYLGPRMTMPNYNEKNGKNELVWQAK